MADAIQDLPGEIWKPVVGFEGLYEVSNMGRVKSLARKGRPHTRLVGAQPGYFGYSTLCLCGPAGRRVTRAHVLVLEHFVGPRPEGAVACHNDGNSRNNTVDNLRWDTQRNNLKDMVAHGTQAAHIRGLTREDVEQIRARRRGGESGTSIARDYGISHQMVYSIQHMKYHVF